METKKLWFADNKIFILMDGGRELWQSLLWYPRLLKATDEQRADYEIMDSGIHWPQVDEDISFESFEYPDPEPQGIARIFRQFPEINASAIARRVGMKQSLLASYISGNKKPSAEQEKRVMEAIENFMNELNQAYKEQAYRDVV